MNSVLVLAIVFAVCLSLSNGQTTRLPSSWNRCSCLVAPKIKAATDACSTEKTHDTIRDCILKGLGVYDGNGDTNADVEAAKKLVDEFEATSGQKESLKKSLDTCLAQSKNRPEDHRTCVSEIIRRRCATVACPPKEK